jgi:cytochrome d ubiquinol oxidase subunit I
MNDQQAANLTSGFLIPGILIIAFYVILLPLTFYFFARVFNAKPKPEQEGQTTKTANNTDVSY